MEAYLEMIRQSQLFSGIQKEEIGEVLSCLEAKAKSYGKGDWIFLAGGTTEMIGLMLEGSGLVVQDDFWGNQNIISPVTAGQTFAETYACAPGAVMNVGVMAESDCMVLFLNVKRILTVCSSVCSHHSQIIRNLLSELAEKNLHLNEKLSHLAQRTTRAKLLSYLSEVARTHGSFEFDIPFSRQQMADYLSVERSGLSQELSKMKREGLLEFRKNHFRLKKVHNQEIKW